MRLSRIESDADGWQGTAWLLERLYPTRFSKPEIQSYHLNAIDNAVWSAGEWRSAFQSQTGPASAWGYWSALYIPDGDAWKIRLLTLTEYRLLSPTTTPKQPVAS